MAAISAAIGAVGLGTSLLGGSQASSAAKQMAGIQEEIGWKERVADATRYQQMLLNSQRQQIEIVRNGQRARALALNAATNQGAQYGSGLAGGLGQIAGQTGEQSLQVNENLGIGRDMFNNNFQISMLKNQLGQAQSDFYSAQGTQRLGASLMGTAPTIGNLTQGLSFGNMFNQQSMNTYGGFLNGINSNGIY